jgi:hypothetical protein
LNLFYFLLLKSQKVNIKIKTVNFEVYTRTRSLSAYTNDWVKIFEAAKFLLTNEWETSKGTLKLRLIGVRVTDLKDVNLIEAEEAQLLNSNKIARIENFFQVKHKNIDCEADLNENETEFDNKFVISKCPNCEIIIEGNKDFYYQHVDFCMK